MDFGLFRAIIEEASRYGARSFSLHLFGEPLLYKQWVNAVEYIKHHNTKHTVLLTTNGILLNREVDNVIGSGVDQVLWSWRPEATFTHDTKEKLRRWGKFRVRFIAEVTPPEAYEEWKEWPNVEGRRLHNYGGDINIHSFGIGATSTTMEPLERLKRWPCYHLFLAPAVAWNGDLLMCCADPHHKEVLGHFPEMSVHQMWTSDRLRAIRESHLKGEYGGICASCDVWKAYPDIFFSYQKG